MYGVLPCSLLFLVAYSWATQRLSRQILFNIIISSFLLLYSAFALLYPSHESLHFHMMADQVSHGCSTLCTQLPHNLQGCMKVATLPMSAKQWRCHCPGGTHSTLLHSAWPISHAQLSSNLALLPALQALTTLPIGLAGVSGMNFNHIADS